ncbi:MAG: multidrug efflux SMR transporter [Chloroflexi bacterium]|nr:multidrug efflux SMR transporter [Chloroflexota bacterium]
MGWLFLSIAIILEVCGTTCMKLSQGFSRLLPSILIFVFYGLSFTAFTFALKYIDLSLSYAVWAGLGVLLIGVIGVLYFKEPITALKITSMVLIVAGVVGLYSSMAIHS